MARIVRAGAARMNIVAIGGGSLGLGETELFDRILISLAGLGKPTALFIPTASGDDETYIREFEITYGQYGCRTEILRLHSGEDPRKIEMADLVYVGGGNTKMMLELWRVAGVEEHLRRHAESGKPVGGVSAGAICWFRVGNSDWPQYEGVPGVNTARLDCLGWVDMVACPHTLREEFRLAEFRAMMALEQGTGLGLDDGCAIQIHDDQYRILAAIPGSRAHRIEWRGGQLLELDLDPHEDFRPLDLLKRLPVAE
jgi:dipeptidase E